MFRDKCGGAYLRLVNQLLKLSLISEHDDVPDVLESTLPLLRLSAQVGARPFLVGGGGY
ncbi:MAG: hypothetical protein KAI84_00105 [Gammaproteobacteria bacterium]|nr:hypothetical protein [Gammaproteobacteria bacterium]